MLVFALVVLCACPSHAICSTATCAVPPCCKPCCRSLSYRSGAPAAASSLKGQKPISSSAGADERPPEGTEDPYEDDWCECCGFFFKKPWLQPAGDAAGQLPSTPRLGFGGAADGRRGSSGGVDVPRWRLREGFASVPGLQWMLDSLFEPPRQYCSPYPASETPTSRASSPRRYAQESSPSNGRVVPILAMPSPRVAAPEDSAARWHSANASYTLDAAGFEPWTSRAQCAKALHEADGWEPQGDAPSRVVSISVSQWSSEPPNASDWTQIHSLLNMGGAPTTMGGDADDYEESSIGNDSPRDAILVPPSPPRLVEVEVEPWEERRLTKPAPSTKPQRPTPYELWQDTQQKKVDQPLRRTSPPRPSGPPPAVRMQRRLTSRKPSPPKLPPPKPPPKPPPPLPPYAGAIPRQPPPAGRMKMKRWRKSGKLPSELAGAQPPRPAPLVCFTNTKLSSIAPRPSQLEPHMQLPQRIHFFLRTRMTCGVSYPFGPQHPDSRYLLTATVHEGYEHAGPSFILDDDIVRRHVIGCDAWPSAAPYLNGELHLELVVPSTEKVNPGIFACTIMVNAGNQAHRGDCQHEKPPPLQHVMASAIHTGNELPRVNVPVTPKPLRPSVRVRKVFNELAHPRLDGQQVMRISAMPLALEALGADLGSWEGRTALQLAHSWASLGGDATVDLFEFAQAARELHSIKPPPSNGDKSARAASQGARSWRYGSPFRDGDDAKQQMVREVHAEGKSLQRTADDSDSDSDEDGTSSLMSAKLCPTKRLPAGRPQATPDPEPTHCIALKAKPSASASVSVSPPESASPPVAAAKAAAAESTSKPPPSPWVATLEARVERQSAAVAAATSSLPSPSAAPMMALRTALESPAAPMAPRMAAERESGLGWERLESATLSSSLSGPPLPPMPDTALPPAPRKAAMLLGWDRLESASSISSLSGPPLPMPPTAVPPQAPRLHHPGDTAGSTRSPPRTKTYEA